VKLLMACFWFTAGVGILVWQNASDRHDLAIHLFGSRFSPGWLAIFMGCFNLVRWGLERAARLQNRQADAAWSEQVRRRIREAKPEQPAQEAEPNPDFNFKDRPEGV
jgi:hypothetical protein